MRSTRTTTIASCASGAFAVGLGLALGWGRPTAEAASPADRLGPIGCAVEDRGVSQPADRNGLPYEVRTHACLLDGRAVAFHFEFLTEPTIHQVGAIDDPEGGVLAVSGDGWRIHLVNELGDDHGTADEIASDTGGEVGRVLSPFVCRIRHPDETV